MFAGKWLVCFLEKETDRKKKIETIKRSKKELRKKYTKEA